jgi:hypothetical protein
MAQSARIHSGYRGDADQQFMESHIVSQSLRLHHMWPPLGGGSIALEPFDLDIEGPAQLFALGVVEPCLERRLAGR